MAITKKIIDLSGVGGLADRFWGDYESTNANHNLRITGKDNQYAYGFVNPFSREGYISPATMTEQFTVDTMQLIWSMLADHDSNYYYTIDTAGTIRTVGEGAIDEISSFNTGVSVYGSLIVYEVSGIKKIFFSYSNDVGIWDGSTTTTHTTAFLSVVPVNAFTPTSAVKMIVSGKYLYMLDNNVVHRFDGTTDGGANGTAYPNVLVFQSGSYLRDVIENRNKLWIAVEYKNSVGIYIWNKQTTILSSSSYIPIHSISHIAKLFAIGNDVYCIAYGGRGIVIMKYDGITFEVIKDIGGEGASPRGTDPLQYSGNSVYWVGDNGYIYRFGEIVNGVKDVLYIIGDLTYNKTSAQLFSSLHYTNFIYGSSTNAKEDSLMIPYDNNGTYTISKLTINSFTDNYPLPSQYYSLVTPLPKLSNIKSITIFYPPISTGGTQNILTVDIYLNQSTTSSISTTLTGNDGIRGFKTILVGKRNINFVQLGMNWDTTQVMTNTITPSYAEIEYETTAKNY